MTETPLDAAEVHRIAALAHLALTDDEVQLFGRQLGEILEYVRQIQAVPTDGVTPMSHVGTSDTPERSDTPGATLDKRAALGNAPDAAREAGFFKVPRVIG
jgi:aspartyl-tRNA(Asn)/glutamyl-tRNA(Gln) amidotransferase subunit C